VFATKRGPDGSWTFPFAEARGTRFVGENDGTVTQDIKYTAFGEATSTGAQPGSETYTSYQWNGGDALKDFGLSQLGARIYDPVIGRFLSRDSLIVPRTTTTTNPYSFAFNDPYNHSDPSGMDGISQTGGGGNSSPIGGGGIIYPFGPRPIPWLRLGSESHYDPKTLTWTQLPNCPAPDYISDTELGQHMSQLSPDVLWSIPDYAKAVMADYGERTMAEDAERAASFHKPFVFAAEMLPGAGSLGRMLLAGGRLMLTGARMFARQSVQLFGKELGSSALSGAERAVGGAAAEAELAATIAGKVDDLVKQYGPLVPKMKRGPGNVDYFNLVSHGDPEGRGLLILLAKEGGKEVGELIPTDMVPFFLRLGGWTEGTPIRLVACFGATCAQQLANITRVPVLGSPGQVFLRDLGTWRAPEKFKLFTPE
jgi:RHS repeat-associated protein